MLPELLRFSGNWSYLRCIPDSIKLVHRFEEYEGKGEDVLQV